MAERSDVKEIILQAATELIQSGSGNITEITTRDIARKAGVGVGLINYHFQTKEQLITLCVQRMIRQVVTGFIPERDACADDRERMAGWAAQVFEFLFGNPGLSRISILADLAQDGPESNSTKSRLGLARAAQRDVSPSDAALLAFVLTSAMQTAFLCRQSVGQTLGIDLEKPDGRRELIGRIVNALFDGLVKSPTIRTDHENGKEEFGR